MAGTREGGERKNVPFFDRRESASPGVTMEDSLRISPGDGVAKLDSIWATLEDTGWFDCSALELTL